MSLGRWFETLWGLGFGVCDECRVGIGVLGFVSACGLESRDRRVGVCSL